MKKLFALVALIVASLPTMADVNPLKKAAEEPLGTVRYFTFHDGQTVAIPQKFIESRSVENHLVSLKLTGDTVWTFMDTRLASEDTVMYAALPEFESFKFNNKFNDQLYTDADGEILDDSIHLRVGCIGKRLTPSFKVPEGATVWVDDERQKSKETRRRFDHDITYTVCYPNNWIYRVHKVSDEVWSTPPEDTEEQWIIAPVNLTEDQLYSNWASSNPGDELRNLLDGDYGTYFHSVWSADNNWTEDSYYGDGVTTWPYLQIALTEPIKNFQFSYTTRNDERNGGYAPQGFRILGSNDGKSWTEITRLDKEKDNMPTGPLQSYTSRVIESNRKYKIIRFQLTESTRKNYLVLSEFSLYSAEVNPDYGKNLEDFVPELLVPAEYKRGFVPMGRDYKVHVDFLTDHSTSPYAVPRIDIWFGDNQSWNYNTWIGRNGKKYLEDAIIQIQGHGVFPDMEQMPIQICGRGNSSWSGDWNSKNPYNFKFEEKQKPLGMKAGKKWVLLANKQGGSMTTNAIAHKLGDMVGTAGCNHIIPVELYINNQYRGSYNLTEKVGFSNNSIDLEDEDNAVMVELDTYYDEDYKFYSKYMRVPVNIKEPDLGETSSGNILFPSASSSITFEDVQQSFNAFDFSVYNAEHDDMIDVNAFCRAMLVTDLVRNTEHQHPKSWYLYNENIKADSLWVFGPLWDFDWSYGYEGHGQYFVYDAESDLFVYGNNGNNYFKRLLRDNDVIAYQYYKLWTEFVNSDKMDEIIEYCDDYFEFAQPSFEHNASIHGDGMNYALYTNNAKNWLAKRANYVYRRLKKFDLGDDVVAPGETEDYGQPDRVDLAELDKPVTAYNMSGIRVAHNVPYSQLGSMLRPGIYIVDGQKIAIR